MGNYTEGSFDISVVVPTYNESETIAACLDSLIGSDNPVGETEIIVVDGMSEDGTREILRQYERKFDQIRFEDNPDRITPVGMNIGIELATGGVVTIISGHSTVPAEFYEKIYEGFERAPDAAGVGGRMRPVSERYFQTGVANALVSTIGSSSTRFRPVEGYVETVSLGAYRQEVFDKVGLMNTDLPKAQDYEFNRRIREAGLRLYQYPELEIDYVPRATLTALARQYYDYGYWKTVVFRSYDVYPIPSKLLGLAAVVVGLVLIPFGLSVLVLLYILFLAFVAVQTVIRRRSESTGYRHVPATITALLVMHISFGFGIVYGSLFPPEK